MVSPSSWMVLPTFTDKNTTTFLRVCGYKYEYDLFWDFVSLLPQRHVTLKELMTRNARTSGASELNQTVDHEA
jgi:hypothetical protein